MKRTLWSILIAALLLLSAEAARAGLDLSPDFNTSREDLDRLPSIEQSELEISSDVLAEHYRYLNRENFTQDSKTAIHSRDFQIQFDKNTASDIISHLTSIHPEGNDKSHSRDITLPSYKDMINKYGYANKKRTEIPKKTSSNNYPELLKIDKSGIYLNLNILGQDLADYNTIKLTEAKYAYESELNNHDLYSNKDLTLDNTKMKTENKLSDIILDTKQNLNNINFNKKYFDGEMDLKRDKAKEFENMGVQLGVQSDSLTTNFQILNGRQPDTSADKRNLDESFHEIIMTFQETNAALNRIQPANHEINQVAKNERVSNGGKNKQPKNYAVVVGISDYQDRMKLRTSVNDANTIATLLDSYGYEIIKLTDNTNDKPTKENIINKALKRIIYERNYGNVVFYFSGHGETDQKGNFNFVLQDESNSHSSYLSDEELRQYTSQIKNLAMIVDACNSGSLSRLVEDDQIVIASSEKGEPSNEIWFGDLSVFTYNLCEAIKEENEKQDSQMILLNECFNKAKEWTTDWARRHLLSQTPVIGDRTGGAYCLNACLS